MFAARLNKRRFFSSWGRLSALLPLIGWLWGGCASSPLTPQQRMLQRRPLYAIVAATPDELAAFTSIAVDPKRPGRVETQNGIEFRIVEIQGRNCLLFVTGMSLVNAAMSTQTALDRYPITHLIFFGAAGGVNPSRNPGDVIIPDRWAYHGEATYVNPRADGAGWDLPAGYASTLPNFGMIFPEQVSVARAGQPIPTPVPDFPADRSLLAAATKVSGEKSSETLAGTWPHVLPGGTGVSSSALVANREYRTWLYRAWQAEVVDLESTAVGQVCWANRVPFASVRVVVGLAGGGGSTPVSTRPAEPIAAPAARVVAAMLLTLPD